MASGYQFGFQTLDQELRDIPLPVEGKMPARPSSPTPHPVRLHGDFFPG